MARLPVVAGILVAMVVGACAGRSFDDGDGNTKGGEAGDSSGTGGTSPGGGSSGGVRKTRTGPVSGIG